MKYWKAHYKDESHDEDILIANEEADKYDNLTFTIVNERMTFFLGLVCETPDQLWQEGILDDSRKFGYRGVYKPLVAYKMLYDLGEKDIDEGLARIARFVSELE